MNLHSIAGLSRPYHIHHSQRDGFIQVGLCINTHYERRRRLHKLAGWDHALMTVDRLVRLVYALLAAWHQHTVYIFFPPVAPACGNLHAAATY
jgi:hypothetical protein